MKGQSLQTIYRR